MNKLIKFLLAAALSAPMWNTGLAFGEEGKAERAGRKLDDAADETKAEAKKAGRETKRTAKKAKRKTGEKVEEAGEKMER